MRPKGMDVYLNKRKHFVYERFVVSPMTGQSWPADKTFTLEDVLDDLYTSKSDIRNFAKLKIGETVQKTRSIVWHVRRIK